MDGELLDRIYEAAFVPEMWSDVLEKAGAPAGAAMGSLFVFTPGEPVRGRCVEAIRDAFETFVGGDIPDASPSVRKMMAARPASFIAVDDHMSPAEIENDPARILLRSRNVGVHACSAVDLPSGEVVMFTFARRLDEGGFPASMLDWLNALRPHLARAGLMAARLGLERAEATLAALSALGLPAAVLTGAGRVLAANARFEALDETVLPTGFGGLALLDADANRLFQDAVAANRDAREPLVRSIPIKPTGERAASVVHALPLRRAAQDIFSGADMLVVLTEIASGEGVPDTRMLAALFDLSPAEARLASALAGGRPLREVAAEMNIGFGSARTYLARIFAKTGVHQQSQLVALLKSARPISSEI